MTQRGMPRAIQRARRQDNARDPEPERETCDRRSGDAVTPGDRARNEKRRQEPEQPSGRRAENRRAQGSANNRECWKDADDEHAVARMQDARIRERTRGSETYWIGWQFLPFGWPTKRAHSARRGFRSALRIETPDRI